MLNMKINESLRCLAFSEVVQRFIWQMTFISSVAWTGIFVYFFFLHRQNSVYSTVNLFTFSFSLKGADNSSKTDTDKKTHRLHNTSDCSGLKNCEYKRCLSHTRSSNSHSFDFIMIKHNLNIFRVPEKVRAQKFS